MKGEAEMVLGQSRGIEGMNTDPGITDMGDLLHIRGMVEMGMGEHDSVYLIPVGFNC